MPSDYAIDPAAGVVYINGSGVLTDADLLEQRVRLRSDPAFKPGYCLLVDFTHVTAVQLSAETVRFLAHERITAPGVRRAIVLPMAAESDSSPQAHPYGLSRMFQLSAEYTGENVEVFTDLAESRRWLGIDQPRPE